MTHAEKLSAAIQWLGSRYVMHPARRVQRLPEGKQVELYRCDVAATIRRVRKELAK